MTDKIVCPSCGKAYKYKPALAGKRVRCGACSDPFVIPDQNPSDQGLYELDIEDAPTSKPALAPDGKCPNCGNKLRIAAIICINCGFNLKEGKRIQTNINTPQPPPPSTDTPTS